MPNLYSTTWKYQRYAATFTDKFFKRIVNS